MPFEVVSLRRYPVKSMGGEPLQRVELAERGLRGDRWLAVQDYEGRLACGKTSSRRFRRRDEVFDYAAHTDDAGAVVVRRDGREWIAGDPALDAELTEAMGDPVRLVVGGGDAHQDGGQVSLVGSATLAWCAERWGLDADPRRLRVNVVVGTDEPFVEETWVGRTVEIGSAALRVVERIPRCRTVDVAQDGAAAERAWLKPLGAERDACLAVYADVAAAGTVAVGDVVGLA